MANMELFAKNLRDIGWDVAHFATAAEAADYLNRKIDGNTVAFGGSVSLQQMGLCEKLDSHNKVIWHWREAKPMDAMCCDVYLSSVNGAAETGELINIDGTCNRVSGTLFGHEKVYLVIGSNKVAPDYESALWRARNIAGPLNARRLNKDTPCAKGEDIKCYNCKSPDRICRALTVFWSVPKGSRYEIILVDEELGL